MSKREIDFLEFFEKDFWEDEIYDETRGILLRAFSDRLGYAVYLAYLEARKGGKRKTHDEHKFEANEQENLWLLKQDLLNHTYAPGRSTAHVIFKPVIREIFAARFRDRIVHHLLFAMVYPWWDKQFIYDSYSCRKGKGVLFGIMRLDHHIRSVSHNYAQRAWVYKFDIKGFFMHLPREELLKLALEGLDKQFKGKRKSMEYRLLRFLWTQIIMDDPAKGAKKRGKLSDWFLVDKDKSLFFQPKGLGIVIGNLTSQLLSNIYLDQLDKFITQKLGYKHYGRYVDDFYIVVSDLELRQLKKDVKVIEKFLESIGLTLHPKKRFLQDSAKGVPFLGAVVYHGYIVVGRRLKRNLQKACIEYKKGHLGSDSIVSYLGLCKHFNSRKMVKEVFYHTDFDYEYWTSKIADWGKK